MDEGRDTERWWQRGSPEAHSAARPATARGLLIGEAIVVASWAFASAVTFHILDSGGRSLSGRAAAVLLVVATGVMVLAILAFARMSSRRIRQGLREADLALESMEIVTDPALSFLPMADLLDELLERTRQVVGVDVATILLFTADHRHLAVRASSGLEQWMVVGTEVPVGEGVIGLAASKAEAVIVQDVGRIAASMPLLRGRVASVMVAPLLVDDRVIGVIQVGTSLARRFYDRDLRLLQLVADRAAASVERARLDESERRSRLGVDQARRHLDLLTRAADVLATALESYEDTLVRLVAQVVPSFADWFAVDLMDQSGAVVRVAHGARGAEPQGPARPGEDAAAHRHPEGDRIVAEVIAGGRPEVVFDTGRMGRTHGGVPAGAARLSSSVPVPGVDSMIVVPVHVRGLTFGALSLVTAPGRRGYRRSDLDTAVGLAERVAIAVERVLMWRESHQAEQAATRSAAQLRLLVEAALAVNAPLEEPQVLRVLAEHARHVLHSADAVVAEVDPAGTVVAATSASGATVPLDADALERACRAVLDAGQPVRSPSGGVDAWLGTPVSAGAAGATVGRVLVLVSPADGSFGAEAEAMVVLLAQMATVALDNARLYQQVQGNEDRLRAVVDSSPLAIAELDLNGVVQSWNAAAEGLFGWSDAPAGSPRTVPARLSSTETLDSLWHRARAGEPRVGVDVGVTRRDGLPADLSVSTAPLRDHAGVVRGILAVMDDVTERRRLLEQFNQTERLAAMARLAGGVAHDFNNLLTVILGASEILLRRMSDSPLRDEVGAIARAGERAAELTGRLLAIGQRSPVQPAVVDPDAVVAALRPMLERALGDSVELEVAPAALPQCIRIDPAELERVLLNLAINAKDAMPDGGSFTIATAPRGRPNGTAATTHDVAVTVSDDGSGMDLETAAHCFDPFFTTKGRARGTGLGLAAVHAAVTGAGGRVVLESEPGTGTTFTLLFPGVEGPADDMSGVGPESADDVGGDETVVVVEDEEELRRLEILALTERGYTVLAADGGTEALALLSAMDERPDLLVTDVVMPGVDGAELVRRLRRRWRTLPVLFVSGDVEGHELDADPGGGPADLLAKPFTPEQLAARVRGALDRAGSGPIRRTAGAQGSKR